MAKYCTLNFYFLQLKYVNLGFFYKINKIGIFIDILINLIDSF